MMDGIGSAGAVLCSPLCLIRQHSGSEVSECFCYDSERLVGQGRNICDLRLACGCPVHYDCLVTYIRSRLGNRAGIQKNGIGCPWGPLCRSKETTCHISIEDLDSLVKFGTQHRALIENPLDQLEVDKLREFMSFVPQSVIQAVTNAFILRTTKACPACQFRATHYNGHGCHHISPYGGGCPNCNVEYCYRCKSTAQNNLQERGNKSSCPCGGWSSFCSGYSSQSEFNMFFKKYPYPHDSRCGCVYCSDCRPGVPCGECHGACAVCVGTIAPPPSDLESLEKWEPRFSPPVSREHALSTAVTRLQLFDACRGLRAFDAGLQARAQAASLTHHLDINGPDRIGRAALDYACDLGNISIVQFLVNELNANVNITDGDGFTPLMRACEYGHFEVACFLALHAGDDNMDVNKTDAYGESALYKACKNGHTAIAVMLIVRKQANVDVCSRAGLCPTYWCVHDNHLELLECLIVEGHADLDFQTIADKKTCLMWAAIDNRIHMVRLLLHHCANPNIQDSSQRTVLHYACNVGCVEIVKLICESPTFTAVNEKDGAGCTAVHLACKQGHQDVVAYLVAQETCALDILDFEGFSPFMAACKRGYHDIVRLLVKEKVDVSRKFSSANLSALHVASFHGYLSIAEILTSCSGASINDVTADGCTALLYACRGNHTGIIRLLAIEHNAEVDVIREKDGRTALHWACYHNNLIAVEILVFVRNASINIQDKDGNGPIHLIFDKHNGIHDVAILKLLLEGKTASSGPRADVSLRNKAGKRASDLAAMKSSSIEVLMMLL